MIIDVSVLNRHTEGFQLTVK